eukprot:228161_1
MEYTASTEPTPYPTTPKNDEYKKQQHRIKEEEHLCLIWRLMHQIELVNTHGPLSKDTYTPGPLATDKHTFKLSSNKHTFELLSQDTYTLTPSPKDKYAPEPTLIFIETSEIQPLELSTTILNDILCITTLGLSFLKSYGEAFLISCYELAIKTFAESLFPNAVSNKALEHLQLKHLQNHYFQMQILDELYQLSESKPIVNVTQIDENAPTPKDKHAPEPLLRDTYTLGTSTKDTYPI